jgi:2,3-bisphosphoglycerate-independent phosphoglycerate mutase
VAFWGSGVRTDACQKFDERSVVSGGIHRIRGCDIMNILTNLMAIQDKFGA